MNYRQVIGVMPGPKLEPAFYLYSGGDAWPSQDNTTCTDASSPLVKVVGRGYCFDCDHPVKIKYDQWWGEFCDPPKTCQECGGHDVGFMGRVAERLWERMASANAGEPVFGANIRDAIQIVQKYIESTQHPG